MKEWFKKIGLKASDIELLIGKSLTTSAKNQNRITYTVHVQLNVHLCINIAKY